jgi:dolichol-phosphate mannosyltransferase
MLYSFVVPIYNDGALARDFCVEMASVFRRYLGHDDLARDLEVIFVDDGSSNSSPQLLKEVCDEFAFARCVLLSRNFGQHIATSAGYRAASGDYVGTLNVDMEEPPRFLPDLLDALKQGDHDIAGGRHQGRPVGFTTRITSYLFTVVMNRLTGYRTPVDATTMRIMTRRSVDMYNGLTEKSRYIPGLESWLGLRYTRVPIEQQPRKAGKSSYNFRRRLRMAYSSVISFSDFPLRLAVKFGMLVASVGMLLAVGLILQEVFGRGRIAHPRRRAHVVAHLGEHGDHCFLHAVQQCGKFSTAALQIAEALFQPRRRRIQSPRYLGQFVQARFLNTRRQIPRRHAAQSLGELLHGPADARGDQHQAGEGHYPERSRDQQQALRVRGLRQPSRPRCRLPVRGRVPGLCRADAGDQAVRQRDDGADVRHHEAHSRHERG